MATMPWPETLQEAVVYFADADRALEAAIQLRWQGRPVSCPTCGSTAVHFIATRRIWRCKNIHPKRQFSVKIGMVMEDSPLGLDKWLVAIWLLSSAKNGISFYELHRDESAIRRRQSIYVSAHPPKRRPRTPGLETALTGRSGSFASRVIRLDERSGESPGQAQPDSTSRGIKLLARDAENGQIGTFQTTFSVPNLARETDRVRTSSVVLGSEHVSRGDVLL